MFNKIHEDYMKSDLDKDAFCKQWKRKYAAEATKQLVDQIYELQQQLQEEKQKREAERDHAQKELLDALYTKSAFEDELIRIFDIEGDHRAIHAMEQRVITKYYQK
jgi:DNA-binding protein H-NS